MNPNPSPTCAEEAAPPAPVRLTAVRRALPGWTVRLQAGLTQSVRSDGENLGHLEERILRETTSLQQCVLAEAAQAKADAAPPRCPCCGAPLSRLINARVELTH